MIKPKTKYFIKYIYYTKLFEIGKQKYITNLCLHLINFNSYSNFTVGQTNMVTLSSRYNINIQNPHKQGIDVTKFT
jgi:hypothetical protein